MRVRPLRFAIVGAAMAVGVTGCAGRRIEGGADAALAASIFHFGLHTIAEAKRYLAERGVPVRLES